MSSRRRWIGILLLGCASCGPSMKGAVAPIGDRATIEQTLAREPQRGDLWRDLAWIDLLAGQREKGRAEIEKALAHSPHDPRALFGAALSAHLEGRIAEARERWADVLERADPNDPWSPAVVEVAAGSLESLVGDASGEREFAARLAKIDVHKLASPLAASRLLAVRALFERKQGNEAAAGAIDRARGCPAAWRVAGPYGSLPRLDLERSEAVLAADKTPGKLVPTRGCGFAVDVAQERPGVAHLTTWVEAPKTTEATIAVDSREPWLLYLDHQRAFANLVGDRYPPRVQRVRVSLPAGWHEVRILMGAPHAPIDTGVAVGSDLPLKFSDHEPGGRLGSAPGPAVAIAPAAPPNAAGENQRIAEVLRAFVALRDGDSETAAAAIDSLTQAAPRFEAGQLMAAQLAADDPSRPARFSRDRARRLLEKVVELDPSAERARVTLAGMDLQDDHTDKALARLEGATSWRAAYARYQAYRARGWVPEEERALTEARKANPEACQPIEAQVGLEIERRNVPGARKLAEALVKCDPTSDQLAEVAITEGEIPLAIAEYRRLLALEPNRESWRSGLARAQSAGGDAAGAAATLSALIADHPRVAVYRVRLADALIAAGGHDAAEKARKVLVDGMAETPEAQELHRALLALGDGNVMDPYRVDGRKVIATFEKSGHKFETPSVIVLDRTVTRVFPTGGRLTLTHNIIRVQTKDGIDKWGEETIPEGADVLLLRTVKADGTTREPEEIAEKQAISVPDLEPGDYVEFEYVDPGSPPVAFPRGFLAERFYFQSFDAPLDRTEYVLVTPSGMPLEVDKRGAAPAVKLEEKNGLTIRTWSDSQKAQLAPEPSQAPFTESVPSVRVGSGITVARWRDYLRDGAWPSLRSNGELRALAAKLKTPQEIDAWTRANIKSGGSLDEAATSILARGEGNRITLERALLAARGIPSEVWLGRPRTNAVLDGPLPDLEGFDEALFAVGEGKDQIVADPRFRHAPLGFLAPLLRGQPALVLAGDGEPRMGKVPEGRPDDRKITFDATLADDGSADVVVHETLVGWPALEWREGLDRLAPDRVRPEFEQHTLGFYFPGASLTDLQYGPRAVDAASSGNDDKPFLVEYRFHAPHFTLAEGRQIVVTAPYPALLAKRFVGVGQRSSPLQLIYSAPTAVDVTYHLPPGATATGSSVDLHDPLFGRFKQVATPGKETLHLVTDFMLPPSRVPPERYLEFAKYAQAVDAAETHAAEVHLK